jgi:D-sedoheptulose 7-phosphate isomerase
MNCGLTGFALALTVIAMNRPTLAENLAALVDVLESANSLDAAVGRAADVIALALKAGKKLLVCGNGGSAADAMHLATEFVVRYDKDRRPYPAICLNVSGGDLTAMGNDYGYEQVFERQVQAYAQPGDVLIVFSTSGKSNNLLLAIEAATRAGAKSVAFLGKGGGFTAGKATVDLIVPATTVTARVQEVQKVLLHTICEIVEYELAKQ